MSQVAKFIFNDLSDTSHEIVVPFPWNPSSLPISWNYYQSMQCYFYFTFSWFGRLFLRG